MNQDRAIERLKAYELELREIVSRFTRSSSGLHIGGGDAARLHQIVIELRDLFDDLLGKNSYSSMIVSAFNEGLDNFLHSSSLNSVKQIQSIVSAAITWIVENPNLIKSTEMSNPPQQVATQIPLELPERVTLYWLYKNVPYRFWIIFGGSLVAAFAAGTTVALKLAIAQQWFAVSCTATPAG